jgi:hypothetical protein
MKAVLLLIALANPACALDLTFPVGTETDGAVLNLAPEHILPVSGFIDGKVERRAFTGTRLDTVSRVSPAQPVDALTEALIAQLGEFRIVFDCRTNICGGFDFRFSLDVPAVIRRWRLSCHARRCRASFRSPRFHPKQSRQQP